MITVLCTDALKEQVHVASSPCNLHLIQLTAEFDRVVGRRISQEIKEGWDDLVPKVIGIAQEEHDNDTIQTLLSIAPPDMTDGKLCYDF